MPAARRELAARTTFIRGGPGRLFLREVGRGLPIVVLHGGPGFDHEYLLPDMDRLADLYRLIYYDQRGAGRSFSGESPSDVTMESELHDLDRVREWAGADSVALLGHSWGGHLAMAYAVRHPDRVSHLILMNTAPASHAEALAVRATQAAQRTPEEAAQMAAIKSKPEYQRGDLEADTDYYRIYFRPAVHSHEALDAVVGRLRTASTPEAIVAGRAIEEGLYAQTWYREDYDLIPHLRQLQIPTLVIHGESDFIPLEIPQRIASAIPNARLVVIPDCGHFAYIERPAEVRSALAGFLTTVASDR